MESIHLRAFDKLKLVVELDFSWNKLNFVPVAQMRQLGLLRRLTMRGNPLYALNETTITDRHSLNGITKQQPSSASTIKSTPSPSAGFFSWHSQQATGSERWPSDELEGPIFDNMNRLFETYPELVRNLVHQYTSFQINQENNRSPIKNNHSNGKNGANKLATLELKVMQTLLQQDQSSKPTDSTLPLQEINDVESDLLDNSAGSNWNDLDYSDNNNLSATSTQFGVFFSQLQELDFGQCKLSYIKWTVFEHFNQLKRLYLDGNHLR